MNRYLACVVLLGCIAIGGSALMACGEATPTSATSITPRQAELTAYRAAVDRVLDWRASHRYVPSEEESLYGTWANIRWHVEEMDRLAKLHRRLARRLKAIASPKGVKHAALVEWAKHKAGVYDRLKWEGTEWLSTVEWEIGRKLTETELMSVGLDMDNEIYDVWQWSPSQLEYESDNIWWTSLMTEWAKAFGEESVTNPYGTPEGSIDME